MPVIARSSALKSCVSVADVETLAKQRLAVGVRDFIAGGAEGQWTLKRNVSQFKKYLIRQKIPDEAFDVDLKTNFTMKTHKFAYDMPFGMAPIPLHGLSHAKAEEPMIKVSHFLKVPAIASILSNLSMQEISAIEKNNEAWLQTYIPEDLDLALRGIELIQATGYKVLVISVGYPMEGRRRSDQRNQFSLPSHLVYGNFPHIRNLRTKDLSHNPGSPHRSLYPSRTSDWKQLEVIVKHCDIPVVLKGVVRGDEAERAVDAGCSGVYVSNQGGRQLDYAPATIECLKGIVKAVDNRAAVFLDSGIRSGSDILKAINLGADLVFLGRPYIYGLSLGGQRGITHVFEILRNELTDAMQLAGYDSIQSIKDNKNGNRVVHESFYHPMS